MIVLEILAWFLVILLFVLVLAVVVPIQVTAAGKLEGLRPSGRFEALWGYGVLGYHATPGEAAEVRVFGVAVYRFRKRDEKPKDTAKKRKSEKPSRGLRWLWRNRHTLRQLMGRLLCSLDLRLRVEGCLGMGDPADTAHLQLVLDWATASSKKVDIRGLGYDWVDEVVDIQVTAQARIWPAGLLAIFLTTFVRKGVRRAWKSDSRRSVKD